MSDFQLSQLDGSSAATASPKILRTMPQRIAAILANPRAAVSEIAIAVSSFGLATISQNLTETMQGLTAHSWTPTVASVATIAIIYFSRGLISLYNKRTDSNTHTADLMAQERKDLLKANNDLVAQWQTLIQSMQACHAQSLKDQRENYLATMDDQRRDYDSNLQKIRDEKHISDNRAAASELRYVLMFDRAKQLGYDIEALTAPTPVVQSIPPVS
jgi:hypothetical protein